MDMPQPLIDVHVHAYEAAAIGGWSKQAYEIWEYGAKEGVAFSQATGELAEARAALGAGGFSHGVIVNMFSIDLWRGRWLAGVDQLADGAGVRPVEPEGPPPLGRRLVEFNEWLVESTRSTPELIAFVGVDPWVLSSVELTHHLEDMRRRGARGIKLHPVDQRFRPDDPRMLAVYRRCVELDLVVLSHSGGSRGPLSFAAPSDFGPVCAAVPKLQLVLAHLGGARWEELAGFAAACPQVLFDLSEIVAWTGAPNAPSAEQLVRLIRDIGVERVLFGSDFPWYDPGTMAELVRQLPGLSADEQGAILGANAARLLGLAP